MVTVKIYADSKFPVSRARVRQVVAKVTGEYGLKEVVVEVSVVGSRKMAELNKRWMKQQGSTDVLSFPMEDVNQDSQPKFIMPKGALRLGDVVVCWAAAVEQAAKKDILVDDEVDDLVEHGVRHLLGEDHD